MDRYNAKVVEPKWQKYWQKHDTFHAEMIIKNRNIMY